MYAVLHASNWHNNNHRYISKYSEGIFFPKNTIRRFSPTSNWRHNCNYEQSPEDTYSFVLWWCKKNAINKIAHIFQRITSQPHIQILPLPPMLPQSQNENLQPPEITSTPAPDPRVKPVSQPPRVKIQVSAPTPPPIYQPYKSPSLDSIQFI